MEVENGESKDEKEEESEDDREEEKLDLNEGYKQGDEDSIMSMFDNIFEILTSPFVQK